MCNLVAARRWRQRKIAAGVDGDPSFLAESSGSAERQRLGNGRYGREGLPRLHVEQGANALGKVPCGKVGGLARCLFPHGLRKHGGRPCDFEGQVGARPANEACDADRARDGTCAERGRNVGMGSSGHCAWAVGKRSSTRIVGQITGHVALLGRQHLLGRGGRPRQSELLPLSALRSPSTERLPSTAIGSRRRSVCMDLAAKGEPAESGPRTAANRRRRGYSDLRNSTRSNLSAGVRRSSKRRS